jgi:tetratricopeptide (TPR) repeat protein
MDDVFSPIIRQFKKINIIPFKVQNETRDCIRKPLEKIGIKHPSEIFDFETYRDVSEIHDLTGGRPYEIQLICHFLFRRIQENRAKSMELTLDVLDDVRKELETSQDVSARPILNLIRNFDKRELSALGLLCICNGHANFEQIWFSEYVFRGDSEWRKNLLWEQLCKLEEMRVITVKDGVIKFSGDDFDKIYCKYFARTYRVSLPMDDFPYEVCLIMNLTSLLEGKLKGIDPFPIFFAGDTESTNFQNVITALLSDDESSDPFEATPGIAEVTYWSCLRFRDNNSFKIATVTVISPWIKVQQWYGYKNPKQDVESALDNLSSILADISERAIAIGGALKVDIHTLPVVPVQSLIRKVERSGNARMRHSLLAQHYNKMIDAYTEQHDIKEAFFHGSLAYHYNLISNDINPWIANNLGYIFLVSDDLLKARQMLKMAANDHIKPEDSALSNYNLGILEAKEGNLEDALISIKLAIERIKTTEEENRQCSYLLSPKIVEAGDMLVFQELSQPDLLATAESAVSTIEELLQKSQSRIGTLVGV